ncbi:hypothetical protein [Bacillus marasmi]|uniref:hypothetical protein n=1 Tax=Bacillus marasmi TaxID=1926279 RepID=UPI0011CBDEC8|nr:hypothetical protein [Bacillus marasmi]
MSIGIAMIGLTYFFVLVMGYLYTVYNNENKEKSQMIINKAYQYAYSILLFGILIVLALVFLPHITLDPLTTSYLILACKFVSVLTLAGCIFIFSKRTQKRRISK